jgi:hypothetical protein
MAFYMDKTSINLKVVNRITARLKKAARIFLSESGTYRRVGHTCTETDALLILALFYNDLSSTLFM